MSKTQEELNQLKKEYESLTAKLGELTEEEFKKVSGGFTPIASAQKLSGIPASDGLDDK